MDQDRKSTGLKSLQGKIWEEGYRSGELKGEVYPDVLPALERWRKQGIDIAIFSSGSVQAQRSLFRNSVAGDLTRFIRAYFDTTTGPKREPESYGRIAAALERSPPEVLFVSDIAAELDAARAAGMQTALCVRWLGRGARCAPRDSWVRRASADGGRPLGSGNPGVIARRTQWPSDPPWHRLLGQPALPFLPPS